MLGTVITPAQLAASGKSDFDINREDSFIAFEKDRQAPRRVSDESDASSLGKGNWASKIRQTIGRRTQSSRDLRTLDDGSSFIDMRRDGWHSRLGSYSASGSSDAEMSDHERSAARKKAQKLGQVSLLALILWLVNRWLMIDVR